MNRPRWARIANTTSYVLTILVFVYSLFWVSALVVRDQTLTPNIEPVAVWLISGSLAALVPATIAGVIVSLKST